MMPQVCRACGQEREYDKEKGVWSPWHPTDPSIQETRDVVVCRDCRQKQGEKKINIDR